MPKIVISEFTHHKLKSVCPRDIQNLQGIFFLKLSRVELRVMYTLKRTRRHHEHVVVNMKMGAALHVKKAKQT